MRDVVDSVLDNNAMGMVIFSIHIDDIYSIADPPEENACFKAKLHSRWDILDLGDIKFTLGISIKRNHESCSIYLDQGAFINRLITRFNLSKAHPADTLMTQGLQIWRLDKTIPPDPMLLEWIQQTPYRELVGGLNYVAVTTQPDISFAVGHLASVLDCYHPEHWAAGLHMLCYLKGTRSLRLVLGGLTTSALSGFCDSDFVNCQDTSCSINGYCFSMGSGVISWHSKKHDHAGDSSCYAEYMAIYAGLQETIFLQELLQELRFLKSNADGCPPTRLYCDNDAATKLSQESIYHLNIKHFHIKYHSICDNVQDGILQVVCIPSADNVSDIFTKAPSHVIFKKLRSRLGLQGPKSLRDEKEQSEEEPRGETAHFG